MSIMRHPHLQRMDARLLLVLEWNSNIFNQVALISHPGPGPRAAPTPVTALAFDPSQELLWTGNEYVSTN